MTGPGAVAHGTDGTVYAGRHPVGRLTEWRIVVSPTTGAPTLIGKGRFLRAWVAGQPQTLTARVTTTPRPSYIGRPPAPPPETLTLTGERAELTARSIVIAHGSYAPG